MNLPADPSPRHGLRVEVTDGVARLTLARPQSGNRINADLAQALCDAAMEIEFDDAVAVVVLGATGDSFCLGVEEGGDWEHQVDWVEAVAALTCPVIAVINGDAVAEGLELALACDLRVVASGAHLSMPQLMAGRLPSHGGTQRLPRIAGRMRALELLLTGRQVDAREAESIGLASRVVRPEDLVAEAEGLARELRSKAPIALRFAKEAVLKGSDLTLDQGIRLEEDLYVLLQTTDDRREGIEAFLARRKPRFQGK